MSGWIGVDFDGTLAQYGGWNGTGNIGEPVPAMLARVKAWLAHGRDVRIFTARVWVAEPGNPACVQEAEDVRRRIQDWCERHIGYRLVVTNIKDHAMVELWDDRAVRVVANTGKPCCEMALPSVAPKVEPTRPNEAIPTALQNPEAAELQKVDGQFERRLLPADEETRRKLDSLKATLRRLGEEQTDAGSYRRG